MNRKLFVELINKHFEWLYQIGYEIEHVETSIYFIKKNSTYTIAINFAWAEHNTIKIHFVQGLKRFNSVENIINKYSNEKLNYTIHKSMERPIPNGLNSHIFDKTYPGAISIENVHQVQLFANLVKDFYENELTKYFKSFKDVSTVKTWLEENDIMKHKDLLVVNRNSMMIRKLVIFKETNSSKFDELYARYSEFIKKESDAGNFPYIKMKQTFDQFKQYFESSKN